MHRVFNHYFHASIKLLIKSFLLLAALGMSQFAHANAGMMLVAEDGGKNYVLLVQTHKQGYYEFPGGRSEDGENLMNKKKRQGESLYETAVRETMEETRGYIGRQQLAMASSDAQLVKVGKFTFFLAKLAFFNLNDIRAIKIPKGKKWAPMREAVNYAWVDVNAIDKAGVVKARDGRALALHPIMRNAIKFGRMKRWF